MTYFLQNFARKIAQLFSLTPTFSNGFECTPQTIKRKSTAFCADTFNIGRNGLFILRGVNAMSTLLEMRHIVKHFAGVLANDHVDFEAQRGAVWRLRENETAAHAGIGRN